VKVGRWTFVSASFTALVERKRHYGSGHDAAYFEFPDGNKFIVVILTRGAADEKALLPAIGRHLLAELGKG